MPERTIVYPDADSEDRTSFTADRLARLEQVGRFVIHYGRPANPQEYAERVAGATGLLLGWDLPAEVMAGMEDLELISFVGIGVSKFVDLKLAHARGVTVCNTPGYASNTVAEHALALMMAACRHVPRLDAELRGGAWNQGLSGMELRGKTIGLIGFGGIGQRFCEICQALGMTVLVWTSNPDDNRARRFGIEFVPMNQLLEASDIVSLHLAQTPESEGLLGAGELARMRPGAILVNTARGEIVDESALVDALSSGHLRAAALDVFVEEPLPASNPLCALDNVVFSPHIGFKTPESVEALYDIAIDNVVNYFRGEPTNVLQL